MDNVNIIKNLLSVSEFTELQTHFDLQHIPNEKLFDYLIQQKIILVLDWSGEEEEFEIVSFLQNRLNTLGENIVLDRVDVYKQLDKNIDKGEIKRGGAIPFILKQYQKVVKKAALSINLLEHNNDTYYITLATEDKTKLLKKAKDDFWSFVPFGTKRGEILYVIYCTCGSMHVWQLKRSDPSPTDEYCSRCNKELFDKNGVSSLAVEKDYI